VPELPVSGRGGFDEVIAAYRPADAVAEAARCLDCDLLCSTCETVCPNRAIFTYRPDERHVELPVLTWRRGEPAVVDRERVAIRQPYQVAVLADLCNDCGNCTTFCPTAGRPMSDKPRLFLDRDSFRKQEDNAFRIVHRGGRWVIQAKLSGALHELEVDSSLHYRIGGVELRLDPTTLQVLDFRVEGDPPTEPVSLRECFVMWTLFEGVRSSVPWIPTAVAEAST